MKENQKKKETIVPVVAPLNKDLSLDKEAVGKIFSYLYSNNAIPFILGTTGESASLSNNFKEEYLRVGVENKPADKKLYVGVSSNILEDSVAFAHLAYDLGIDAVAATLPTYYKLSDAQIGKYFLQLAEEIPTDLVVYNIPATTHMSIPLELLDELSHHPKIVGTKDSERSIERLDKSLALWKDREDFKHYMGWAGQSAYAMINGSDGIIPSSGNFAPGIYTEMCLAVERGDYDLAYAMQKQSDDLGTLYQADKSLGESLWGLKVLMRELSLCESHMMPPLSKLSKVEEEKLITAFYNLINQENIKLNIASHV